MDRYKELISKDYEVFVGKTYKGEIDFVVIDGKLLSAQEEKLNEGFMIWGLTHRGRMKR